MGLFSRFWISAPCSPDERSDIRDGARAVPGCRYAHPGYEAPSALLQVQPAHVVPLAERHTVGAQDVVGGGGVKIEVRQRERHQKALGDERQLMLAEVEHDVLAGEPV